MTENVISKLSCHQGSLKLPLSKKFFGRFTVTSTATKQKHSKNKKTFINMSTEENDVPHAEIF